MQRGTLINRPRTKNILVLAERIRSGKARKEPIIEDIGVWIKKIESHQNRFANYSRGELIVLSNMVLYKLLEVSILADQFQKKDWLELHNAFDQFKKVSGVLADYLIVTKVMSLN